MNTFDFNDKIRFLLPDDYNFEQSAPDVDGNMLTAIRADERRDDDGNTYYDFDCRVKLFVHNPNSFGKGFTSDRLLGTTMENLGKAKFCVLSTKPATNLIHKKVSFPVFGIQYTANSYLCVIQVAAWRVLSLTVTKRDNGDPDVLVNALSRLMEVAEAVRLNGKKVPFLPIDLPKVVEALDYEDNDIDGIEDVTPEILSANADSSSRNKGYKKANPDISLYPHYKQHKNSSGPIAPGVIMITNQNGTDYEFIPLSRAINNSDLAEEEKILYQRIIKKNEESTDLFSKASAMQSLFHVNPSVFNEKRDRECEIEQGLLQKASMISALRSFAWTLVDYCEASSTEPGNVSCESLKEIIAFCAKREWLNYNGNSHLRGLCGCSDLHVFYVPDAISKADRKQLMPSDELIKKTEQRKAALPYYNPILDEVNSLDELRKDLTYIYPAIKTLWDSLAISRNYNEALIGNEADIVYAWCSLAKAAKEPFYVEDGPMNCFFTQLTSTIPPVSTKKGSTKKPAAGKQEPTYKRINDLVSVNATDNKQYLVGNTWLFTIPNGIKTEFDTEFTATLNGATEKVPMILRGLKQTDGSYLFDFSLKRYFNLLGQGQTVNDCRYDSRFLENAEEHTDTRYGLPVVTAQRHVVLDSDELFVDMYNEDMFPFANCVQIVIRVRGQNLDPADFSMCIKKANIDQDKFTRISKIMKQIADSIHLKDATTAPATRASKPQKDSNPKCIMRGTVLEKYIGTEPDVVLPDGITELESSIFSGRTNLRSIIIPETVKTIGYRAFENCFALEEVALPSGLESIGDYAFVDCHHLKHINLGNKVNTIGGSAFSECYELQDVSISDHVQVIDSFAFKNCRELTRFIIPNGVNRIGFSAFVACSKLEYLFIPASVTTIMENPLNEFMFAGCEKLVIHTPAGSYAEQYAREHGIPVIQESAPVIWIDGQSREAVLSRIAKHPSSPISGSKEDESEDDNDATMHANEWIKRYGNHVESKPKIQFSGKLFVFSGIDWHGAEKDNPIVQAVINKGGQYRSKVSGITDYLVVDPRYCGESKTQAALEQQSKGKSIKIILLDDLNRALGTSVSSSDLSSAEAEKLMNAIQTIKTVDKAKEKLSELNELFSEGQDTIEKYGEYLDKKEATEKEEKEKKRQAKIKALAAGKSEKDLVNLYVILTNERKLGKLRRSKDDFYKNYEDDFPAFTKSELLSTREEMLKQMEDTSMCEYYEELFKRRTVKDRFTVSTLNLNNVSEEQDVNAKAEFAIENTKEWYKPNEMAEVRRLMNADLDESKKQLDDQLGQIDKRWTKFVTAKDFLHLTIKDEKAYKKEESDSYFFEQWIDRSALVSISLYTTGFMTFSAGIKNFFPWYWGVSRKEIWEAAYRNEIKDQRSNISNGKAIANKAIENARREFLPNKPVTTTPTKPQSAPSNLRQPIPTSKATAPKAASQSRVSPTQPRQLRQISEFVCLQCGYTHLGKQPPEECPICKAPAEGFKEQKTTSTAQNTMGQAQYLDAAAYWDENDEGDAKASKKPDPKPNSAKGAGNKAQPSSANPVSIKAKKKGIAGWIILLLLIALAIAFYLYGLPYIKYRKAKSMLDSGDYSGAINTFESLGAFMDSNEASQYARACDSMDKGNLLDAIHVFESLGEYGDSATKKSACIDLVREQELADFIKKYESYINVANQPTQWKTGVEQYGALESSMSSYAYLTNSDVNDMLMEAKYCYGIALSRSKDYDKATSVFAELGNYKDSVDRQATNYSKTDQGQYEAAMALVAREEYTKAANIFLDIKSYLDSNHQAQLCLINAGRKERRAYPLLNVKTDVLSPDEIDDYRRTCYNVADSLAEATDFQNAFALYQLSEIDDYESKMKDCNKQYISTPRVIKTVNGSTIKNIQCVKSRNNVHFIILLKKTKGEIAQNNTKNTWFEFWAYDNKTGQGKQQFFYANFGKNDSRTTVEFDVAYSNLKRYEQGAHFEMRLWYRFTGRVDGADNYDTDNVTFSFSSLVFKDLYGEEY